MELEVKKNMEWVNVPDNVYNTIVTRVKQNEYEYGPVLIINFKIKDGPYGGKEVNGLCKASMSIKSKLYSWVTAMGILLTEGQKFNTDSLVGKECKILTKTKNISRIEGELPSKVSNVDKVLPA